jgi:hypothetical protein
MLLSVVGLCLVLFGVFMAWGHVRIRRIAAARTGESFETFRGAFGREDVAPEVLRTVYATFQAWWPHSVAAFPVRADDALGQIYGIAGEDLDDAVMDAVAACGRRLPPDEQLRGMRPIVTVRDLACFLSACPEA